MASEEGCGTNLDLSVAKADMHCRAARCFARAQKAVQASLVDCC